MPTYRCDAARAFVALHDELVQKYGRCDLLDDAAGLPYDWIHIQAIVQEALHPANGIKGAAGGHSK